MLNPRGIIYIIELREASAGVISNEKGLLVVETGDCEVLEKVPLSTSEGF